MSDPERGETNISKVDRRGTTVLVPLGIGAVFTVLAVLWVSMASHDDRSSAKDVMTRPNAPTRSGG